MAPGGRGWRRAARGWLRRADAAGRPRSGAGAGKVGSWPDSGRKTAYRLSSNIYVTGCTSSTRQPLQRNPLLGQNFEGEDGPRVSLRPAEGRGVGLTARLSTPGRAPEGTAARCAGCRGFNYNGGRLDVRSKRPAGTLRSVAGQPGGRSAHSHGCEFGRTSKYRVNRVGSNLAAQQGARADEERRRTGWRSAYSSWTITK